MKSVCVRACVCAYVYVYAHKHTTRTTTHTQNDCYFTLTSVLVSKHTSVNVLMSEL